MTMDTVTPIATAITAVVALISFGWAFFRRYTADVFAETHGNPTSGFHAVELRNRGLGVARNVDIMINLPQTAMLAADTPTTEKGGSVWVSVFCDSNPFLSDPNVKTHTTRIDRDVRVLIYLNTSANPGVEMALRDATRIRVEWDDARLGRRAWERQIRWEVLP